jgi:hypothetical protein
MADSIEVELVRVVDRDQVLETLRAYGFDARRTDHDGAPALEVRCGPDWDRACDEIVAELESWIAERGIPLVPERIDDRVLLRPPAS